MSDVSGYLFTKDDSPISVGVFVLKVPMDEAHLASMITRILEADNYLSEDGSAFICSFVQMYADDGQNIPIKDLVAVNDDVDFPQAEKITKKVRCRRKFIYKYIESSDHVFTIELSLENLTHRGSPMIIIEDRNKPNWIKTLYE